jgi:uncharacterized membrane protein YkvA (DUF1232 family)
MNRFFTYALRKAASSAVRPSRLLLLISQLALKLKEVNWKDVSVNSAREKFSVLGRLIKAYALGHYRDIPWKTILLILAAVIYFVNPIDLLPDMLPITGLTDDFGVLLWVYNTVNVEIEKFLTWEKSQVIAS